MSNARNIEIMVNPLKILFTISVLLRPNGISVFISYFRSSFSLFQGLPSSAFNVSFFVIRILLFSFPSLILIAAWRHFFQNFKLWVLLSDFHFLWPACDSSFRLLAFNILKFTWVVSFSMLHLRFGIRLSVFNFQLLAVGIKSSDYRFCHSASGF